MQVLQRAGVPAGAVLTPKELWLDPHLKEREHFQMLSYPKLEGMEHLGKRPYLRMPSKVSKTQINFERSPLFGEHNDYVFGELLGMTRREMAELEEEGVIGKRPLAEEPTYRGATTVPCPILKELGRIEEWDENFHEILGLD